MFSVILISLITFQGPLAIDLWVDREDATYYPTENVEIFFRTNDNCFVSVYNIEGGGRVTLLFPPENEDGRVEAGITYKLPPETEDYDYVISGPEGAETIIALASRERLPTLNDEAPDIVSEAIDIYIEEPEAAKLRIITTPERCRIYITDIDSGDEEYIGKAPRTLGLRPGEYIIKIRKLGYRTLTRRVWLEPGEHRRVFVKLRPY